MSRNIFNRGYCLVIVFLLAWSSSLTAGERSNEPAHHRTDCDSSEQVIRALRETLDQGRLYETRSDPADMIRIYRQGVLAILRQYPNCPEICDRLRDIMERSAAFGRLDDQAGEWKRSLDTIIQDYDATPDDDLMGTDLNPASNQEPEDQPYEWMTDPYFLMLELIFLALLFLIREVRRMGYKTQNRRPQVRAFRYREIPDRDSVKHRR